MTSQAVKLKVTASVVRDCTFWAEDDGWGTTYREAQWYSFGLSGDQKGRS
ncbi:MAG: hypothetical protein ACRD23_13820 [Terriglobales bacterium]